MDTTGTTGQPGNDAVAVTDLEKLPIERVLAVLDTVPGTGLSAADAGRRLDRYGPNAIVEKEKSLTAKLVGCFTGPIAYLIEAAAAISAFLGHWEDFAIIAALLLFNAALDLWQDLKASNALAALKKGVAPVATARRIEAPHRRRHPVQPQVVPESRGIADPLRGDGRDEAADAEAHRRPGPDPQGLPQGFEGMSAGLGARLAS